MDRKVLVLILATIFLDGVGIGIVFPIMPDLMTRVGALSVTEGAFWGGLLMSAYAAMQFLFGPVVGGISDAFGRRPVLLVALAALAIDYVIMALADTLTLLMVGRILAGIAGATYITATACLADISPPHKRAANFGLIGGTFGLAFVLGPALGGLTATIDISAPFWIAGGIAAVNFAFAFFLLPESLPVERRRAFGRRDLNPFGAILAAFRMPGLALPLVLIFVFEFANMVYPVIWSFWTRELLGWSAALIGLSLAVYGGGVALTQGGVMRVLLPRLGESRVLLLGMVTGAIASLGFGMTGVAWAVFAFLPLAALSDMVPPTMTAIMANQVDEDRQGVLQGVIASLASIAAITAPVVMTAVFQGFTGANAPVYLPGAPFLLAGVLMAATLPFTLRLMRAAPPPSAR